MKRSAGADNLASGSDEFRSIVHFHTLEERRNRLAELFETYRARLRALVKLRLDPRLQQVVDPSDVLQDAFLVASKRLEEYLANPKMSPFLWLRLLSGQRLHELHEFHFGAQKRDERRKVPIDRAVLPEASAVALAARLVDGGPSPSEVADASDKKARIREAIEGMESLDREILALRFYEALSTAEAAETLGIEQDTARKRYLRAMKRLKAILGKETG